MLAGAEDEDIAFLEPDPLGLLGRLDLVAGDPLPRLQPLDAPQPRDVDEDAPSDDAVPVGVDAVRRAPAGGLADG